MCHAYRVIDSLVEASRFPECTAFEIEGECQRDQDIDQSGTAEATADGCLYACQSA